MEGRQDMLTVNPITTDVEDLGQFIAHQALHIKEQQWHQLCNDSIAEPLKVIEIQYGDATEEADIERLT